jgi:hypothetical protein
VLTVDCGRVLCDLYVLLLYQVFHVKRRCGDIGTSGLSAVILEFLLPVTSFNILLNATVLSMAIHLKMGFAIGIVVLSSLEADM